MLKKIIIILVSCVLIINISQNTKETDYKIMVNEVDGEYILPNSIDSDKMFI